LAIQHSATAFDTSPQALIALHAEGVTMAILNSMLAAESGKPAPPAGPAAPLPAKNKANPPNLRTIRKVVVQTGWEDDEPEIARKITSIQKHTCLTVVETEASADAILVWSLEALTGGALELRSKDGQVLWSKEGNFTTPLKALKQALGCPK